METEVIVNRFEKEIMGIENWLNDLDPRTDGVLIGKLEVILDNLITNFIRFLKENDTQLSR